MFRFSFWGIVSPSKRYLALNVIKYISNHEVTGVHVNPACNGSPSK